MPSVLRSARMRRVIPATLSGAMLLVILAAALAPNTGAISADSSCQYGNCTQSNPGIPIWLWGAIGGIILAAVLAAVFLLYFRRRRGGASTAGRIESEMGPTAGAAAGTEAAEMPAYMETESDIGAAPAVLPPAGAGAPAPAAGEEPNIDSLMDELDRISGEMQKKESRPRGPNPPPGGSDETQ